MTLQTVVAYDQRMSDGDDLLPMQFGLFLNFLRQEFEKIPIEYRASAEVDFYGVDVYGFENAYLRITYKAPRIA